MGKLVLNYVGVDDWSRPVFKDENGYYFKDTNCGDGLPALCTASDFYGEPDTPIEYIKKFHDCEIEVIGMEEEPTPAEKFNYQLLSRLQQDCDYYLGNGNRNKRHLWAEDEFEQIEKMKELWNSFDEDKKPEWLTWDEILEYAAAMGVE